MHIFSAVPGETGKMAQRRVDPVFITMLVTVMLAVGSSLLLRLAVGNGPKNAQAAPVVEEKVEAPGK